VNILFDVKEEDLEKLRNGSISEMKITKF